MRPSDDAYAPDLIGPEPVDPPGHGSAEISLRSRATARWQGATVALISGAILFGACQGDNLWSGNSETTQPKIVGIASPAQVYPGDTIQVQVSAYATRQVQRVEVSLSGAASLDTSVTLSSPAVSVAQTFRLALPGYLSDTTLIIKAIAYDKVGAASRQRTDTARAVAPPMVISFSGPDSVRPGSPLRLALHAVGVRPVTRIRVQLRGGVQKYDSIVVMQPRRDVTDTITFPIGATEVVDTSITVDMQAVDNSGLAGYVARTTLPVAIAGPSLLLVTAPDTVHAGANFKVTVQARALRNITKLRFSLSGATYHRDSTYMVPLPSHNISEDVFFLVPATTADPSLDLSVQAVDASGVASAQWRKVLLLPTDLPVVDNLIVGDSIRPGTPVDARVVAHASRPLSRIDLSLRGATDKDVFVSIPPIPAQMNVTQDFSVLLPDPPADSMLVVRAKATDMSGAVSPWYERVVRVSDTAVPTVTMTLGANNIAAGRPLTVRVVAKDNVGLGWVGARILTAASLQIAGDSVYTSGRSRDTTFSIIIPQSGPQTLTVVGFARDRGNREGKATATIAVIDSTAPVVNIVTPADNATLPIGDALSVTVSVTDIVGIKRIALTGIALRTSQTADPVVVARYSPVTVNFPQPPSLQLPLNPTITRVMAPTADTTAELVRIIAVVTDSLGNEGVDTSYVNLGGPRVEIRSPVNNGPPVTVGMPLTVRMFALDPTAKIDSLRLDVTGALVQTIRFPKSRMPSPSDSVLIDTLVTPSTTGTLTLNLSAWNGRGIIGRAINPVNVQVVPMGTGDTYKPFVQMTGITYRNTALVDQNTRVELTDTIRVHVQATDNGSSGIKRMGMTVIAIPNGTMPGIVPETLVVKFATARTGTQDTTFSIVPRHFGFNERIAALGPKLSVQLQFHAFAVDAQGNCGATTRLGVNDSIACAYAYSNVAGDTFYTAASGAPLARTIQLVGGYSKGLPDGGNIADAAVDNPHGRLYLSNIAANRVNILELADSTFRTNPGLGLVGSQPWGLFLNGRGDSLFVANSGGTTISFLVVDSATAVGNNFLQEDLPRRLITPNEVLWEVNTTVSAGFIRYTATFFDFSDRPQFVAQDIAGRVLFSTKPTGSAPDGTLRVASYAWTNPVLEPHLLFNDAAVKQTANYTAIAFLDSLKVVPGGDADDAVLLYDHVPGHPSTPIATPSPVSLTAAIAYMKGQGSDIAVYPGRWELSKIGMTDTTFVAVAGDRSAVVFGEGAAAPTGRILLWDGVAGGISNDLSVQDLVSNASERVFGLGLDADGGFGVARGAAGAYFFTGRPPVPGGFPPALRLQGTFSTPGGAGGAALHPSHAGGPTSAVNALAFVSTPDRTVKILDSAHFYQRGEISLRDNVVGPVKAALPLPAENGALAPTDPNYILVKLYCVTGYSDGTGQHTQVVIVNVRNKDLVN